MSTTSLEGRNFKNYILGVTKHPCGICNQEVPGNIHIKISCKQGIERQRSYNLSNRKHREGGSPRSVPSFFYLTRYKNVWEPEIDVGTIWIVAEKYNDY